MQIRATEGDDVFGKCGCGRSPTGVCVGWHSLTETQLAEARRKWELSEYSKQAQELWSDSCTTPRSK